MTSNLFSSFIYTKTKNKNGLLVFTKTEVFFKKGRCDNCNKIKIKFLLFFILSMVSDLTVIKHNHSKSKYPVHKCGITWQPRVHPPVTPQGRLQKIPILLCRKITKLVRNQTHGEWPGRGIRRTTMETIGNITQSKRPRRGGRRITSEFINKWGIFSVDMDCLPKEKFFLCISTGFLSNAGSSFVRRPEGVCVIRLCFFHAFINHWFRSVYPFTKFNSVW